MSVVARVQVTSVEAFTYGSKVNVGPVFTADENDPHWDEIKTFFEATPNLTLSMTVANDAAAEHFQPGGQFYLRFEKIDVG